MGEVIFEKVGDAARLSDAASRILGNSDIYLGRLGRVLQSLEVGASMTSRN